MVPQVLLFDPFTRRLAEFIVDSLFKIVYFDFSTLSGLYLFFSLSSPFWLSVYLLAVCFILPTGPN